MTYHRTRKAAAAAAAQVTGAYVIAAHKGTYEYAVVYPKREWEC